MSAAEYVRGSLPGLVGQYDLAVLKGDTHISKWVREAGRLDHDQSALPRIGSLIRPTDTVWDVGAFIGDHTAYYASLVHPYGLVRAFEAAPDAFQCLCHNMRFYSNVLAHMVIIGDGGPIGRLVEDLNRGARYARDGSANPTTRLDDIPGSPNLIKLDIEGREVDALRGARNVLKTHHPILVCEVNRGALERAGTSPAELFETLQLEGYRSVDLFTGAPWHPADPRPQFDVVARWSP